jgi:DNA polymerase III alpha subunit
MRMGLTVRPPDVNASRFRTRGKDREVRIGFQFIKGLADSAVERVEAARRPGGQAASDPSIETPFVSFEEFRARTNLRHDDLRLLIQVGACDSISGGMTRPMLLWMVDAEALNGERDRAPLGALRATRGEGVLQGRSAGPPALREYNVDRRRRTEFELLGFTTDGHPMDLFQEELARLRVIKCTDLHRHVGQSVLCAGMLTTAKPVHTIKDEPMEFATFDDGAGLIEGVLFPEVYRKRGHVLFDQGPFLFRGKVEEEFGAVTVTITQLDRLERAVAREAARRSGGQAVGGSDS